MKNRNEESTKSSLLNRIGISYYQEMDLVSISMKTHLN